MLLTTIYLFAFAFVIPELTISIFGLTNENPKINFILQILNCRKCFNFWLTLITLSILFPFNLALIGTVCISTGMMMILDKLYNYL